MNAKALKALLQKFHSLPPHFRYPLLAAAAVVVLVAAHSVSDRPAPAPTSGVAIASVPAACNPELHPGNYWTSPCEDARAKRDIEASESPYVCHFKGQIVGCVCAPGSRCAANAAAQAKWDKMIAEQRSGPAYVPPPPAASAKPAPAATTATVASASTAVGSVPVAPVAPPTGVKQGLLHTVTEGRDQFGAWLTLSKHITKAPTLAFTVPAAPSGTVGARRVLVTAWIHLAQPVQTITLRESGPAAVTLNVDEQSVATEFNNGANARSEQAVVNLVPGWYLVKLAGTDPPAWAGASRVEIELGSTNLNPVIPAPYWSPAKATTTVPAAHAKSTPVPVPASTTAAPKAARAPVKAVPVPVPAEAGTARTGRATVKEGSL